MLLTQLDVETPTYSNLGVPNSYGNFDLGFSGLRSGMHALGVALPTAKHDGGSASNSAPYLKICFRVR